MHKKSVKTEDEKSVGFYDWGEIKAGEQNEDFQKGEEAKKNIRSLSESKIRKTKTVRQIS